MDDGDGRNCFEINRLPQVVFLSILSYLDVKNLGRASCVSKHWYNSTLDPSLWRRLKLQKRQLVNSEVLVRITNYGSSTATVLDLTECRNITEEGLLMALQQCQYLVELYVVRCPAVTDKCLAEMGQNCRNIKVLDISLCPGVTDNGVKEVSFSVLHVRKGRYKIRTGSTRIADLNRIVPFQERGIQQLLLFLFKSTI